MTMDRFIQQIAKKAGAAVLTRFGKDGVHYTKSDHRGDVVTKADLLSERIIISAIKKNYPQHGIIAEESGRMNDTAEYVWIIDPVDGTLNFSLGVPLFGVMIALAHKRRILLSAIYLPASKELFFAKAGKGAFLNGRRIRRSRTRVFRQSMGTGPVRLAPRMVRFLKNFIRIAGHERGMMPSSLGSMAVNACYVACGRRDWIVAIFGHVSDHDFAPVSLVLKEAGCRVTDTQGNPWKLGQLEMVAANPTLHKQLLRLTKNV